MDGEPKQALPEPAQMVPYTEGETGGELIRWERTQSAVLSTIDTSTDEGKTRYLKCLTSPTFRAKARVGEKLPVVDFFLHRVERVNKETGEVVPGLRLVFVLDDGRTVATSSEPVMKTWYHVANLYGRKTYSPPLVVTLKAMPCGNGHEFLDIESVERVGPSPRQPKK